MSSNIIVKRICDYCKNTFDAKTTKTKYCSHICNSRGYKLNQKLKKIETSDTETKSKVSNYVMDVNSKDFLTVNEASTLLNMSSKTVYRLIEQNELNAFNINRTISKAFNSFKQFIELYLAEVFKVAAVNGSYARWRGRGSNI